MRKWTAGKLHIMNYELILSLESRHIYKIRGLDHVSPKGKLFQRWSRLLHFDERLRGILRFYLIPTIFADVTNIFRQLTRSLLGVMAQRLSLWWSGPCFHAIYARFWPLHLHASENELCLTPHALHLCRLVSVTASDLFWCASPSADALTRCSPAYRWTHSSTRAL